MNQAIQSSDTQFLLFETADGSIRVETRMQDESIWLTINQLSELFGVDKSGISRHLKNIPKGCHRSFLCLQNIRLELL